MRNRTWGNGALDLELRMEKVSLHLWKAQIPGLGSSFVIGMVNSQSNRWLWIMGYWACSFPCPLLHCAFPDNHERLGHLWDSSSKSYNSLKPPWIEGLFPFPGSKLVASKTQPLLLRSMSRRYPKQQLPPLQECWLLPKTDTVKYAWSFTIDWNVSIWCSKGEWVNGEGVRPPVARIAFSR